MSWIRRSLYFLTSAKTFPHSVLTNGAGFSELRFRFRINDINDININNQCPLWVQSMSNLWILKPVWLDSLDCQIGSWQTIRIPHLHSLWAFIATTNDLLKEEILLTKVRYLPSGSPWLTCKHAKTLWRFNIVWLEKPVLFWCTVMSIAVKRSGAFGNLRLASQPQLQHERKSNGCLWFLWLNDGSWYVTRPNMILIWYYSIIILIIIIIISWLTSSWWKTSTEKCCWQGTIEKRLRSRSSGL